MRSSGDVPVPGVRELEHTADVGLEFTAPTLPELFRRAALGSMWLVLEREAEPAGGVPPSTDPVDPPGRGGSGVEGAPAPEARVLELVEPDLPALLRSWLRTLLFWEETEGFVTMDPVVSLASAPLGSSPDGQAVGLRAQVRGLYDRGQRVREIKGVTLHGLAAEQVAGGWWGRVIFDV
jgi:SHS2 domain-containing protein